MHAKFWELKYVGGFNSINRYVIIRSHRYLVKNLECFWFSFVGEVPRMWTWCADSIIRVVTIVLTQQLPTLDTMFENITIKKIA